MVNAFKIILLIICVVVCIVMSIGLIKQIRQIVANKKKDKEKKDDNSKELDASDDAFDGVVDAEDNSIKEDDARAR